MDTLCRVHLSQFHNLLKIDLRDENHTMNRVPYLIIGNSTAAIGAVEGIRRNDPDGRITLVADEPEHTYSRPLISYLLGGEVGREDMYYRPPDFYEKNGIDARLGIEVVSLDPRERVARTADGGSLPYDKCLIATGGSPIVPPDIAGIGTPGVFTFTRWADVRRIEDFIKTHDVRSAVVVGGGLIGLKSMEALAARGIQVTLVELANRVLSATFDDRASDIARQQMEKAGVDVRCGNTVTRIESENGRVTGAILADGSMVDCSMVIFAIGVRPRMGWLEGSGVETGSGIRVDERMETNIHGVFAAGDVAEAKEMLSGEMRPVPIFPNAYRQGLIAGYNMAGSERRFEGALVMNSVEVFGLPTISVGLTDPERVEDYEIMSCFDVDTLSYKKIVLKGNVVVGAIFIGDIDRAGIFTGLIKGEVNVAGAKDTLLSDDFGLINLPAEYRKHVVSGLGIEV